MIRPGILALAVVLLLPIGAEARQCRPGETPRLLAGRSSCDAAEPLKPYDPDLRRAGQRPGYIDLGNGTEVRVGGRVQMDYDARRR